MDEHCYEIVTKDGTYEIKARDYILEDGILRFYNQEMKIFKIMNRESWLEINRLY